MQKIQQLLTAERQIGLSLTLGVSIWFLHLTALNALTSVSCRWGWFAFRVGGLEGLQFVELLITLMVSGCLILFIYLSWRHWREYQFHQLTVNPRVLRDTERDWRPLVAFLAMLLNALFLVYVLAFFVPMFSLDVCNLV